MTNLLSLRNLFGLLLAFTLGITSCSGNASVNNDAQTTASGYECPLPADFFEVTSTELDILTRASYIPREMAECFQLIYGVKVNFTEYTSAEEMYTRIAAGGRNYDLVLSIDHFAPLMIRQGFLQELDHSKIPIMSNFDPDYLDLKFDPGNKYTIPYQAGTIGIAVNTEVFSDPPGSWADLWSDEYAGPMVFLDSPQVALGMTMLTLGYDINTTDMLHIQVARDKLNILALNLKFFDSSSPGSILAAGDAHLGVVTAMEALNAQRRNPAIQYIYPAEGPLLWLDNWAVLHNAGHQDAAYAWLNYTMQGNVFWMMLRDFQYTNPNTAALDFARENKPDLYENYINSSVSNIPSAVFQKGHYIEDAGELTPLYNDMWVEIKGGK